MVHVELGEKLAQGAGVEELVLRDREPGSNDAGERSEIVANPLEGLRIPALAEDGRVEDDQVEAVTEMAGGQAPTLCIEVDGVKRAVPLPGEEVVRDGRAKRPLVGGIDDECARLSGRPGYRPLERDRGAQASIPDPTGNPAASQADTPSGTHETSAKPA